MNIYKKGCIFDARYPVNLIFSSTNMWEICNFNTSVSVSCDFTFFKKYVFFCVFFFFFADVGKVPVAVQKDLCLLSYCLDVAVQGLPWLHCIFKTRIELFRTVTLGLESLILQLCSWIIVWIWIFSLDAWITADFKSYEGKTKPYFEYTLSYHFKKCFLISTLWPIQIKKNNERKCSYIFRMLKCHGQVTYLVEKWKSRPFLKDIKTEIKNMFCVPNWAE